MIVCVPPVLGNWFAVGAGSPEFIAQATAENCPRWTKRKIAIKRRREKETRGNVKVGETMEGRKQRRDV